MKTKNNVQKTVLSSAAVIVSLVLLSFNVRAQDFWKAVITNSSFNELALATAGSDAKHHGTTKTNINLADLYLQEETEEVLPLENWMTETSRFENAAMQFEIEAENQLEVENWMLDAGRFESSVAIEESLEVERWMTNEKTWGM